MLAVHCAIAPHTNYTSDGISFMAVVYVDLVARVRKRFSARLARRHRKKTFDFRSRKTVAPYSVLNRSRRANLRNAIAIPASLISGILDRLVLMLISLELGVAILALALHPIAVPFILPKPRNGL